MMQDYETQTKPSLTLR